MMYSGRVRFYEAERNRLKYCAEQIILLCNTCDNDDREVIKDILKEMQARLDMWDLLSNGAYDNRCSDEEKEFFLEGNFYHE